MLKRVNEKRKNLNQLFRLESFLFEFSAEFLRRHGHLPKALKIPSEASQTKVFLHKHNKLTFPFILLEFLRSFRCDPRKRHQSFMFWQRNKIYLGVINEEIEFFCSEWQINFPFFDFYKL
jgi:hypothetical protein